MTASVCSAVCQNSDTTVGTPQPALARKQPPAGIKTRPAFLRVQSMGKRFRGRFATLLVVVHPSDSQASPQVGFTVSRKVGNAVVRNRVRRRLREITRIHAASLVPYGEHVFIALGNAPQASYACLQEDIICLLSRARTWASEHKPSSSSWRSTG